MRLRLALLAAATGFLLVGCGGAGAPAEPGDPALVAVIDLVDVDAFRAAQPGTWVELSRDAGLESVSVLSYDPTRPPPARQEVAAWGKVGSGPQTMGEVVLSVAVQDGSAFYVVEFDPDTRAQLFEDGAWFLPEDRAAFVDHQLGLITAALP